MATQQETQGASDAPGKAGDSSQKDENTAQPQAEKSSSEKASTNERAEKPRANPRISKAKSATSSRKKARSAGDTHPPAAPAPPPSQDAGVAFGLDPRTGADVYHEYGKLALPIQAAWALPIEQRSAFLEKALDGWQKRQLLGGVLGIGAGMAHSGLGAWMMLTAASALTGGLATTLIISGVVLSAFGLNALFDKPPDGKLAKSLGETLRMGRKGGKR